MQLTKSLFFLALSLGASLASEAGDERTTEAVVKAVVKAESEEKGASKESKKKEEASAVAKATTEVLETETLADDVVPEQVIEKAKDEAKKTFKELKDGGAGTKAAAAAAAKEEVATVDGAADLTLPKEAKDNAEKAAVAAGKAVADHPDSQDKALTEAISTVKKEEKTGKADLKKDSKGVVAGAAEAVSDLPKIAEGAAEEVDNAVRMSPFTSVLVFVFGLALVGFLVKYYETNFEVSDYVRTLKRIRQEFDGVPQHQKGDIETEYQGLEFDQMR